VLAGGAEKEGERRRRAACFRFRDSVPPCYSTRLKTLAPATNKCTLPLAVRSQVSRRVYHAYSVFSNFSCISLLTLVPSQCSI
jgi:hypothetical protein